VHLISFQCVYLAHIRCGLSLVGTETRNASWNVNKLGKSPAGCGAEEAEAKLVDVRRSKSFAVAEHELLCECWREAREIRHGAITSIRIEYRGVIPVIEPKAHDQTRSLGRPLGSFFISSRFVGRRPAKDAMLSATGGGCWFEMDIAGRDHAD